MNGPIEDEDEHDDEDDPNPKRGMTA